MGNGEDWRVIRMQLVSVFILSRLLQSWLFRLFSLFLHVSILLLCFFLSRSSSLLEIMCVFFNILKILHIYCILNKGKNDFWEAQQSDVIKYKFRWWFFTSTSTFRFGLQSVCLTLDWLSGSRLSALEAAQLEIILKSFSFFVKIKLYIIV